MLSLSLPFDVLLFSEPIDLRKSYDGLAGLVREHLDRDVLDGGLFVFLNKRRNRIKLLFWVQDGLVIVQKRLELGCFSRPASAGTDRSVRLTPAELGLLLEGIEVLQARRSRRYRRAKDRAEAGRGEAL